MTSAEVKLTWLGGTRHLGRGPWSQRSRRKVRAPCSRLDTGRRESRLPHRCRSSCFRCTCRSTFQVSRRSCNFKASKAKRTFPGVRLASTSLASMAEVARRARISSRVIRSYLSLETGEDRVGAAMAKVAAASKNPKMVTDFMLAFFGSAFCWDCGHRNRDV